MSIDQKTSSCIRAATKVIGDRWNPRLIFAIGNKVTRFCAIQRELDNVNPRSLSMRLDRLESMGIIRQHNQEYELTEKGKDLLPIIALMANWSLSHGHD